MLRRGALADSVPMLQSCAVRTQTIALPPLPADIFHGPGSTISQLGRFPGSKPRQQQQQQPYHGNGMTGLTGLQTLQRLPPLLKCKTRVWLHRVRARV
jgi:hypothetical protein